VSTSEESGFSKLENPGGVEYPIDDRLDSLLTGLGTLLAKDMLRLKRKYGLTLKEAIDYYAGRRELPAREDKL